MSTERDFAIALAMLSEAMGEKHLTPVRIEAYHRGLKDVPLPLLQAAVDRLIQTMGSDAFRWTALPLVADIRKVCEQVRLEQLARHPYEGCCDCEHSRGWRTLLVDGITKVDRCPCLARHREKLRALGLSAPLASLTTPPEALEPLPEPSGQLPASVEKRLTRIAGSKVMR
jgi:hypothetical protein